jgi:hypothetical protein
MLDEAVMDPASDVRAVFAPVRYEDVCDETPPLGSFPSLLPLHLSIGTILGELVPAIPTFYMRLRERLREYYTITVSGFSHSGDITRQFMSIYMN